VIILCNTNKSQAFLIRSKIIGILHEGSLDESRRSTCQDLANRLESVKNKCAEEILKCVVYIYTLETFLYRLINTTLRNEDWNKFDTLGPFCYLLQFYLLNSMLLQSHGLHER
jgi:hypothetical protein